MLWNVHSGRPSIIRRVTQSFYVAKRGIFFKISLFIGPYSHVAQLGVLRVGLSDFLLFFTDVKNLILWNVIYINLWKFIIREVPSFKHYLSVIFWNFFRFFLGNWVFFPGTTAQREFNDIMIGWNFNHLLKLKINGFI